MLCAAIDYLWLFNEEDAVPIYDTFWKAACNGETQRAATNPTTVPVRTVMMAEP